MCEREIPKRIKRRLRELSTRAHEEELRRALLPLSRSFDEWREGRMSSGELVLVVRDFDRGPAREMFVRYNRGPVTANVAYALREGLLKREEVEDEVIEHLAGGLAFFEYEAKADEAGG